MSVSLSEIWQRLPRDIIPLILQYVPHLAYFFDRYYKWIRKYTFLRKPILVHIRLNRLHEFLIYLRICRSSVYIIIATHSYQFISGNYYELSLFWLDGCVKFRDSMNDYRWLYFEYSNEMTLNGIKICGLEFEKNEIFFYLCENNHGDGLVSL